MTTEPKRFVVIGAGGVGGWLLDGLAHFAEYRSPGSTIIVVDGDHFEEKNKERQNFSEFGNKAESRAFELQSNFPNTMIIPIAAWVIPDGSVRSSDDEGEDIVGYISPSQLLQENDVVFPVVDNYATRRMIFDAARNFNNIDIVSGGNDDGLFASTYIYRRRDGVDITDHPIVMHEEYINPTDRNPGLLSCSERSQIDGGHQLLVANMAAATMLLAMTHRMVYGDEQPGAQTEWYLDFNAVSASAVDRSADEESITRVTEILKTGVTTTA